jgi:hypothetical protein
MKTRLTKGLFHFLSGCYEAQVYERGDTDSRNCVPAEQIHQLEWEGEQIYPHRAVCMGERRYALNIK